MDSATLKQSKHWSVLADSPMLEQGAVGTAPAAYAAIAGFADPRLENRSISRQEVIEKCQSPDADPWLSFIRIMSWGAQDKMPAGKSKVLSMFSQKDKIILKILDTRNAKNRSEAFEVWSKDPVMNLWIAYFTKILFFLRYPNENCYIMDKWTASSYNLLTGATTIKRHHRHMHSYATDAAVKYHEFCDFVGLVAQALSSDLGRNVRGMEAEAAIFSVGGRGKKQGRWRAYIKEHAAEIGL